jgi:leader peptidase (prepilin peptidase)/N-methyltransferase
VNLELLALAVPFGYLVAVAPPLAFYDMRWHRLPNALTVPGIGISLMSVVFASTVEAKWMELILSIGVSVLILIIGYPLARAELLGMGDIKLLIAFALPLAFISPLALLIGVVVSLLVANLILLPKFLFRRLTTQTAIPMGPYLLIGLIAVFGLELWSLSPAGVWS